MTDNVAGFDGVTTLDVEANKVLAAAIGKMDRCLIVGTDNDGKFYFAGNFSYGPEITFYLNRAIRFIHRNVELKEGE